MRLVRITTPDGIETGEYQDGFVMTAAGNSYEVSADVELEVPCKPSALYCLGRNYQSTVEGEGSSNERPDVPSFYLKSPTSVLAHDETICYPDFATELACAGELAAVIGEQCRDIAVETVPDVIRGYTIMNDLGAIDQPNVAARKVFDGSAPLGPWIETALDPRELETRTTINGEVVQSGSTDAMLFDPFEAVAFLSKRVTLFSGDVIAFGGPGSPSTVEPGDVIEITYDSLGTLRTTVGSSSS